MIIAHHFLLLDSHTRSVICGCAKHLALMQMDGGRRPIYEQNHPARYCSRSQTLLCYVIMQLVPIYLFWFIVWSLNDAIAPARSLSLRRSSSRASTDLPPVHTSRSYVKASLIQVARSNGSISRAHGIGLPRLMGTCDTEIAAGNAIHCICWLNLRYINIF